MRTAGFPASTWWTNARSMLSCAGRRSALLVMLNLAAAAIYFVHLGRGGGLGGYRLDLDVYRTGARVLLHGGDLYGRLPRLGGGHVLPFTYPPFAALAFIPLALAGYSTASWLLTAVTIASVAVTLWCFAASTAAGTGTRMRRLLPWALPAALLLEPVRSTLTYGQINALLMALVTVDCLTRAPRWPRGIGVGIAAALKLTPGVFVLFFLLRRDLRSAARAGLSFALCTSAGFALAPTTRCATGPRSPTSQRGSAASHMPPTSPSSAPWPGSASPIPGGPGSGSPWPCSSRPSPSPACAALSALARSRMPCC